MTDEPLRFDDEGTLVNDWSYVQIRSWHVIRAPLAHARTFVTLCGRTAVGDVRDTLPAEPSCEACFRTRAFQGTLPTANDVRGILGGEDDGSTQPIEALP